MRHEIASEFNSAAARMTPVAGVMTAQVAGWGVQQWMYAATIGYVVLQAGYLLWKWRSEWKARREPR